MNLLLVVNPTASSVTPKKRAALEEALAADHDVTVAETEHRDHATELARQAVSDGRDVVVVFGGDGTLNEAANALVGTSTALAALPGGSTSVFARTIGMTNNPTKATRLLVDALARGSRRRIGLGQANERFFLFNAGLGFDAAVVEQVEKRGTLKRRFGHAMFVYATFATWFRHYDRTRPLFAVELDGEAVDDGYFAICLKTNPYTFLGPRPFNVAPGTGFDTGLAVLTFRTLRFATIMAASRSALGDGRRLTAMPDVVLRTDLDHVTVQGRRAFPYQLDGDYLGKVDRLELRHQRDCLDLVLP